MVGSEHSREHCNMGSHRGRSLTSLSVVAQSADVPSSQVRGLNEQVR